MPLAEGFADLQTPEDLFGKLKHDFGRVSANLTDTYAAFDFFVTADSLVDWLHPDEPGDDGKASQARTVKRKDSALLRVSWDLACGGKHFKLLDKRHKSVEDTRVQSAYFSEEYFSPGYFATKPHLVVDLSEVEVVELGTNPIRVDDLARQVLDYWQNELRM
jgi:hypothetical protein